MEKLVGVVTHYFNKAKVAVVELRDTLKIGDRIMIASAHTERFRQTVESMEMDHKKVEKADAGSSVGIKVVESVREGFKVYYDS